MQMDGATHQMHATHTMFDKVSLTHMRACLFRDGNRLAHGHADGQGAAALGGPALLLDRNLPGHAGTCGAAEGLQNDQVGHDSGCGLGAPSKLYPRHALFSAVCINTSAHSFRGPEERQPRLLEQLLSHGRLSRPTHSYACLTVLTPALIRVADEAIYRLWPSRT